MSQEQRTNTRVLSRENILSLYLPAATLALGAGIAIPALPVYVKSFDVSFGVASQVFVAHMLGGLLASIPTGFLVDRFGRRKVVLLGPVLVALSSFLTASAQSFPELLVYRFLGGWAQQMWMLGRLAMIADTGGDRQRGRQITGMLGMETVGRLLGPTAGGFLAAAWDIRVPFILHGVLSLLAIIPSYKVLRETAPASGRSARAEGGGGPSQSTIAALLVYPVLIFFFAQFLASLTRGTLHSGAVNLYPVYWYGIGPETLGVISTMAGAVGIPIVFSTGAIMDRFGRKKTVVPGFVLLSLGLAFIAATAFLRLPFEAFVVAFLVMHAAQNITSGNMQVIGSDIAPAHVRGKFFGVWRTVGEVGQVASPLAFAYLAEAYDYGIAFMFLCATAMATALVLGTQVKEPLKRQTAGMAGATEPATARKAG